MGTRRKLTRVMPVLRRYGAPHRRWLVSGLTGTVIWVAFRLAMPWPLKGVIEAAFPNSQGGTSRTSEAWDPLGLGDPVLQLCAAYFVCALGLALGELLQRGAIGRFAARTVDDLREAALRGASRKARSMELGGGGDLIARLVSDAARLREDLRGICVHAAQNSLLFVAVVAIVLVLSPQMGAFFLAGGLAASFIGYRAASASAKAAGRARESDGAYAATLDAALAQGNLALAAESESSEAEPDDGGGSMIDWPTLQIHAVLALTVFAALVSGVYSVRAGRLDPGAVFVFVAYALTVHRRLVQLGRQLGRIGKVRASIDRLATLLHEESPEGDAVVLRPLFSGLRMARGRLDSVRGHGDKPRLRSLDLSIAAGTHVAVLGKEGAGKSSLLRVLAGLQPLAEGELYWDEVPLADAGKASLAYLPQDPLFPPQKLSKLLGLEASELSPEVKRTLEEVGASRVIARLPRGLGSKISALTLSKHEARALSLAAIVLGSSSVWVLDAPLEGLSGKLARRRLREILQRGAGHTLVVSMPRLLEAERFDHVVVLKRGKLAFVGTPSEWAAHKARPNKEASSCER